MLTRRAGLASVAVLALLAGTDVGVGAALSGAASFEAPIEMDPGFESWTAATIPAPRLPIPFAPPPLPNLSAADPLEPVDVTGSIETPSPAALPAPNGTPPGATKPPTGDLSRLDGSVPTPLPAIVLPAPDVPAQVVIDAPPASAAPALTAADLAEGLGAFAVPDTTRRRGETALQARQRQADREAIVAFYAAHDYAPLWIESDRYAPAARAALAQIDRAGEDGLSLTAYAVPALSAPDRPKLVAAEIAMSEAVVAYARQASGGRIDPQRIDPLITAKPTVADAADVLTAVLHAADPAAALRGYNPSAPAYAALRTKLAEMRQQAAPMARESIPSGPTLKLGMRDARVPLIRARFGLDLPSADIDPDELVYDTKVAAAVAEFQRTNGLPASGILTPKTVTALSGGNPSRLENELISNMERWRWVPRDLGTDHISVNVPDFSLEVVRGDAVVHRARVVVGKPDHQTPIFSDLMRFIIVNPYWNVPLSIIKKEMMPKLEQDPNYFANHGYEVVERDGTTYVRQPPGEDNALGRIKFMFPNDHAVYLHDTNARALFGKDRRALSHGCVRVDQPFKLAEVVLGAANGWSEARIKKMIGGKERTINLPAPLPIHIMYFTAFIDPDGGLQLRDDVYGYSAKVKLALGLQD